MLAILSASRIHKITMMSSGANHHTLYFIAAVNLSGVKAQFQLINSSRVVTKGECW